MATATTLMLQQGVHAKVVQELIRNKDFTQAERAASRLFEIS